MWKTQRDKDQSKDQKTDHYKQFPLTFGKLFDVFT